MVAVLLMPGLVMLGGVYFLKMVLLCSPFPNFALKP